MIDFASDWIILVLWAGMGAGFGYIFGWLKDPRHWAWMLSQMRRKPYAVFREYTPSGRRYFTHIKEQSEKLELGPERGYIIDANTSTMEYGPFAAPEFVLDTRFGATRDILADPRVTIPLKATCPECNKEIITNFSGQSAIAELPNPHSVTTIFRAFKEDGLAIARMLYEGMEKSLQGVPQQIWLVAGAIILTLVIIFFMLNGSINATNTRLEGISQNVTALMQVR